MNPTTIWHFTLGWEKRINKFVGYTGNEWTGTTHRTCGFQMTNLKVRKKDLLLKPLG
jgi:hypothetical protein